AVQAVDGVKDGRFTSEALVSACLERIERTEPAIKAWAHIDADAALSQARELDRMRAIGHALGALHGVPIGLKDIVDTSDMPTECGTEINAGRQPDSDARLVEELREAGAVIMGKTATTEFAFMCPAPTTNPHDASRTPGGSSSGSAAAVAARHVPLAIGTQTGGSVIRPASFCGVYGFKPTRGTISRSGLFRTSVSLDQVGGFANTVEDIGLLTDALAGFDQRDPDSFARPRAQMLAGATANAPIEPNFAWFDMPFHDRLDADANEGLEAVLSALGGQVERFDTAPQLAGLVDVHRTIYDYELAENMAELAASDWDRLSAEMQEALIRAKNVSQVQYEDALAVKSSADAFFKELFNDVDAVIAPSAVGEALPLSAGSTGDAIFCTIWTLAGLPCLTMPLLVGENEMPIGVQLIGAIEEDDRLLRTANWMQKSLADGSETGE
ncbi:MAG: amidase, partial [Pseudomonadota bacterium]